MLHARRQISEIIRSHRIRLGPIMQNAFTFQDKIDLFITIVEHGLATAMSIERNFREPGHASHESIVGVALSEDRFEMASCGCQVTTRLAHLRNVAMQPRGIYFPFLSQELSPEQHK